MPSMRRLEMLESAWVKRLLKRLPGSRATPSSGAKPGFGGDVYLDVGDHLRLAIEVKVEDIITRAGQRILEKIAGEAKQVGRTPIVIGARYCIMDVDLFCDIVIALGGDQC